MAHTNSIEQAGIEGNPSKKYKAIGGLAVVGGLTVGSMAYWDWMENGFTSADGGLVAGSIGTVVLGGLSLISYRAGQRNSKPDDIS